MAPRTSSIVIPSYNYARFVGQAIESALRQTRPTREVIVVDDGSTDDTRAVISRFGARVRGVFKENGGHASAINAGCLSATGDVVFLLDADDELLPETVETVLASWKPETVMMHCRLSLMDAQGCDIPGSVPPPWVHLDEGDVRPRMLSDGGYSTTVTSGLSIHRDALARVLPIPEERFRQGADGYLVRAIAFLGPVQAVDRPLARYRRHGSNDSEFGVSAAGLGLVLRRKILYARNELEAVKQLAHDHGLEAARDVGERAAPHLFLRLSSLTVDPKHHPVAGDSRLRLLPRFLVSEWHASAPAVRRFLAMGLTTAAVMLPRALGWRLLAWWLAPAARPRWLSRIGSWRHRRRAR